MGALSGINLYLTVFATGLAIQQHWIVLAPQYSKLAVLGDPAVVLIAGVLYFLVSYACARFVRTLESPHVHAR